MARTRNLKPSFFKNEILAELGCEVMMLFAGLWTIADREGRLEDRPKRIKAEIFPYSDIDVNLGLQLLASNGFIVRYVVDNMPYIAIPTWNKHQTPHIKEQASIIPAPDMHGASTGQEQVLHMTRIPLTLNPSTLTLNPSTDAPDKSGEVVEMKPKKPSKHKAELVGEQAKWFESFWELYWRRTAKDAARQAFQKKIQTADDWEACKRLLLAEKPRMMQRDEEKRPHPATWLNREDFHDSRQPVATLFEQAQSVCPTCRLSFDICSCRYNPYA